MLQAVGYQKHYGILYTILLMLFLAKYLAVVCLNISFHLCLRVCVCYDINIHEVHYVA